MAITPIENPVITGLKGKDPSQAPAIFGSFFSALIGFMLGIATLWAFINLIQGGILWISSGGDKGAVETARDRILHAILGLGITFAAWAVYILVLQFLGMSDGSFKINLPTLF